jgi:hypothetical protein
MVFPHASKGQSLRTLLQIFSQVERSTLTKNPKITQLVRGRLRTIRTKKERPSFPILERLIEEDHELFCFALTDVRASAFYAYASTVADLIPNSTATPASNLRSCVLARLKRDITVPIGISRIDATSL